jgi:hypothetical protein
MGLYFFKASVLVLYCRFFTDNFRRLRVALFIAIAYVGIGWLISFCLDTFWCLPISDNWYGIPNFTYLVGLISIYSRSLTKSNGSVWNSWQVFRINYAFNLSSDCISKLDIREPYHDSNA